MRKPGQFLLLLLAIAVTITAIPGNVMAKSNNKTPAGDGTNNMIKCSIIGFAH